jgi:nitroreductase
MTISNPVLEAIRGRRSIRDYARGAVSREQLEAIADAGRLAPSAMNEQAWEFVVVTRPATLEEIARLAPDNGPFIADAAACIVVAGARSHRSLYLDGAAAVENMLLAIHSLGLASCWVQAMEKDYGRPIADLLGIPASHALVAMLPVGVPASAGDSPSKRPLASVLHWERMG